jgi:outer membrane protein
MRKTFIAALIATSFMSLNANAGDLLQTYKEALANDAQYRSARSANVAGQERSVQARSALLPLVTASAGASRTSSTFDPDRGSSVSSTSNGNSMSLSLQQSIFNLASWEQYEQSKLSVAIADTQLAQAKQDLILRVSQAYFDVLAAQNVVETLEAQKTAVGEQLASAKRNFEVGTQTITDTHEAQSRYDLVLAQEAAAKGGLDVARSALQQIIGKDAGNLAALKAGAKINAPMPTQMTDWVDAAEKQNYNVIASKLSLEIAQREIKKSRAGHYPTVGLSASTSRSSGGVGAMAGVTRPTTIGLNVSIPVFSGFGTDSRVKETVALEDKSRSDLENARRFAAQNARQAYVGVTSGLAQIKGYEAAEISSQSSLDSNKLGYTVGVRINIDVLNAQQQLSTTRQNLAKARYDTIMNGLRLKAASGTLSEADLNEVNAMLAK